MAVAFEMSFLNEVAALVKPKVVALDDDALYLDILVEQLRAIGVDQVFAHTRAEEALRALREHPVDVVISDLDMPDVDGPRFLHQLADIGAPAQVLLISGTRPELLASVVEFGRTLGLRMLGGLSKPVDLDQLGALLRKCETPESIGAKMPQRFSEEGGAPLQRWELERALQDGSIRPWYQPKVDSQSLRVIGVEALARWLAPDGRVLSPARFVPAMEAEGLAWPLFLCMFNQVLKDLGGWQAKGWPLRASVNLSMDCTDRLDLPEQVSGRARDAGVALEDLTLEITESRLMANRAASLETLNRLALMHVELSIDDFGTGYSSLAQLADLPFSELKIDAGFVRRIGRDQKIDRIVQATVAFGTGLGMKLVAEGVEHHSQLRQLRKQGVHQIQGYLCARPMSAQDFCIWLERWRPGHLAGSLNSDPVHVLAVGPEVGVLTEWCQTLQKHVPGIESAWAIDEALAVKRMASQSPDVILVDARQFAEEAWSLAERLRERCPPALLVIVAESLSDGNLRAAGQLDAVLASHPLTDGQVEHWVRRIASVGQAHEH